MCWLLLCVSDDVSYFLRHNWAATCDLPDMPTAATAAAMCRPLETERLACTTLGAQRSAAEYSVVHADSTSTHRLGSISLFGLATAPLQASFGGQQQQQFALCYQPNSLPVPDHHQSVWVSSAAPVSASAPVSHVGSGCCSWTAMNHSARIVSSGSTSAAMRWVQSRFP